MIAIPGSPEISDVPVTLLSQTPSEANYVVSRAGRVYISAQEERGPTLWRELDLQPGESKVIDVPRDQGTLQGKMSSYSTSEGSIHGFAGPRMQIIADDPSDWSVTVYLPNRANNGDFTIEGIPPGAYHVYHHLIGEKPGNYVIPKNAWGGVPVNVSPNATARLGDFAADRLGEIATRITDSSGRPIDNATLRIRDRMSDSWRQYEENPAVLEEPAHPIPYPPSRRIVGGQATLPSIRTGWLEFTVEMDTGVLFDYRSPVALGEELRVTVPTR
jgi:hypothetical protein